MVSFFKLDSSFMVVILLWVEILMNEPARVGPSNLRYGCSLSILMLGLC